MAQGTTTTWYKGTTPKVDLQSEEEQDGYCRQKQVQTGSTGFFQVFGEDYDQTYSSVANFTSIRTLFDLSAQLELTVRQMDVDTAFLNAPIEEDIWVQLPKGSRPASTS